jgi:SAM-dependent methyltransferase
MTAAQFDFERSRAYWRHAPSGSGKADSTFLLALDERRLCDAWDAGFRQRFLNYPEEEQFLRVFAGEVRGRRVLSIGSGLGFHELYYASAGAAVTCADIVDSNLSVIEQVARAKNVRSVTTAGVSSGSFERCVGQFDVVFIYGCLMHMPTDEQRRLMSVARRSLVGGGSIVLMVYGWEFVRRTCGWTSIDQFDPTTFARHSDPVVAGEACPWADWYDDAKLLELAAGMRVSRKQMWNDRQYVWYELAEGVAGSATSKFFRESALSEGVKVASVPLRGFTAGDAELKRSWRSLGVETNSGGFAYAASAPAEAGAGRANAVAVSLELLEGGCSVGVLDDWRNAFIANATITTPGRHQSLLLAPDWPREGRIVFSNHQSDLEGRSRFAIQRVTLLNRPIAAPPIEAAH